MMEMKQLDTTLLLDGLKSNLIQVQTEFETYWKEIQQEYAMAVGWIGVSYFIVALGIICARRGGWMPIWLALILLTMFVIAWAFITVFLIQSWKREHRQLEEIGEVLVMIEWGLNSHVSFTSYQLRQFDEELEQVKGLLKRVAQ